MRFTGYAVLWDRVDRAGDVFREGAFAAGEAPLLWQHRGEAVGRVSVEPDARGLCLSGEANDPETAHLVRTGTLTALSVGYRAKQTRQGAWREILMADLVKVSLVAQPMQPGARIERIDDPPVRQRTDPG